ncbi:MAG TPA: YciI family protein [Draconibacterium sp.]|nr:YciI family protein [Draconibacterium sp.]
MKQYVLVMLKTGENKTAGEEETNQLFKGLMENINRLAKEGKLIVAGPLGKNKKTYRGIFIFDVPSIEEANILIMTDPAIKANLLAAELYEWYGSAALAEYLPAADKIWKIQP